MATKETKGEATPRGSWSHVATIELSLVLALLLVIALAGLCYLLYKYRRDALDWASDQVQNFSIDFGDVESDGSSAGSDGSFEGSSKKPDERTSSRTGAEPKRKTMRKPKHKVLELGESTSLVNCDGSPSDLPSQAEVQQFEGGQKKKKKKARGKEAAAKKKGARQLLDPELGEADA